MSKQRIRSSQIDASSFVEKRRTNTYTGSAIENFIVAFLIRPVFISAFMVLLIAVPAIMLFTDLSGYLVFFLPVFFMLMFKSRGLQINSTLPGKKPVHIFKKDKAVDLGELIFGREEDTGLNLYQASADTLRHTIIIGSSGSGKTVFIYCVYIYNYLSLNSGFWMQDFKGATDVSLIIQSLLALFGRSNCARVMNYNGRQQVGSVQKQSNTNNPMLSGDFEKSLLFLFGFIPEGTGDGKFFVDGAQEILRTVMPILHHLQEKKLLNITSTSVRQFTGPMQLQALYFNDDVPDSMKQKYLKPFFDTRGIPYDSPNAKIPSKLIEQYSSFTGNFSAAIALLGTSFSQIHESVVSEFDPVDIFKNRRCAVTLVPVSGLTEADLSALSTANANLIKFTFDAYLDGSAIGNAEDISGITRGPDDTPMALIVDELGMGLKSDIYGLAVAQGRGFGIAFIGGTQDADKPVSVNQGQWSQIEGSAFTKLILNAANTTENEKMFQRWVTKKTVMRKSVIGDTTNNTLTNIESKLEEDYVLDLSKIPEFDKGEFYFIQGSTYSHGRIYYNDPTDFELPQFRQVTKLKVIRYNRLTLQDDLNISMTYGALDSIIAFARQETKNIVNGSIAAKNLFNAISNKGASLQLEHPFLTTANTSSDTEVDCSILGFIEQIEMSSDSSELKSHKNIQPAPVPDLDSDDIDDSEHDSNFDEGFDQPNELNAHHKSIDNEDEQEERKLNSVEHEDFTRPNDLDSMLDQEDESDSNLEPAFNTSNEAAEPHINKENSERASEQTGDDGDIENDSSAINNDNSDSIGTNRESVKKFSTAISRHHAIFEANAFIKANDMSKHASYIFEEMGVSGHSNLTLDDPQLRTSDEALALNSYDTVLISQTLENLRDIQ